jgi:DNA-binding NarL/FixJ family response regulator
MPAPSIRILVVDDYEPFRRFFCATLGKKADLQVIGEVSDGLLAVQKAAELQPDLIVLDLVVTDCARSEVSDEKILLFVARLRGVGYTQSASSHVVITTVQVVRLRCDSVESSCDLAFAQRRNRHCYVIF